MAPSPVGRLLQHWRAQRRMSQLALATEAGVTPRHVSFVESGRANPSRDMVLRLAVSLVDVEFEPGDRVRLEGEYAPGHARTTVSHLAAGEPLRTLPAVRDGDLHLERGGKSGEATRGTFSLSFEVTTEYGGGRNVHGSFSGVTGDASFDRPEGGPDAG